jgi:hypothetical protein
VVPLAAYEGTAAQHQQMEASYESSQELTVASVEQNVAPGSFEVAIDLPPDIKGRCVLSGYLYGDSTWAVGSQRISLRKPK